MWVRPNSSVNSVPSALLKVPCSLHLQSESRRYVVRSESLATKYADRSSPDYPVAVWCVYTSRAELYRSDGRSQGCSQTGSNCYVRRVQFVPYSL